MSRISLSRRLAALLEAAEQIDPRATAVHRMPPATRLRYELWRVECDAVHERYAPGELYAAYLDTSEWPETPEPHPDVASALGMTDPPHIPADATTEEVASMYADMIGD